MGALAPVSKNKLPLERIAMNSSLLIKAVKARTVDIPIEPLKTASGVITSCPLVLIEVETDGNVVGRSYIFAYTRLCLTPLAGLIRNLEGLLVNKSASPFEVASTTLNAFRLLGTGGLMAMALGGLD